MPAQNDEDDIQEEQNGPGARHMSVPFIVLVGLYLVFLSVLVLYGLVKLWPHPTPSGEPKDQAQSTVSQPPTTPPAPTPAPVKQLPDPEPMSFFWGRFHANVYLETRLLLIVMLAGALGSLMHALRSLYWYAGNRMLVWSWSGMYLLLPFTGAVLAVIFYFVVRGGFFSPQASFENTSPFGFAALSALVGLFSPQATLKLKEVAETIFTKPGKGEDSKPEEEDEEEETETPKLVDNPIDPTTGPVDGGTKVIIMGQGFVSGVAVKFGSESAVVDSSTNTSIEVTTPKSATGPGAVDVEVTNPDGQKVTLPRGFTYVE